MWLFRLCNNIVRFQDWFLKRKRFMPSKKASSKGERAIVAALEKYGIPNEMQYKLGYYVHVDFAVTYHERLYLIEYDGRQHYHPVKYFGGRWRFFLQRLRDILENRECKSRNIPLLRVRYDLPLEQIESTVLQFLNKDINKMKKGYHKIGLKDVFSGLSMGSSMLLNFTFGSAKNLTAKPDRSAWEEERTDILERANWLCRKIIKSPQELIDEAPKMIGEEYQGEWAIYCCSMLAHALANICVIYPDKKEKCPELIARLIDIVNTPEIRKYDTMQWKEDAMETLDGDKSHMTYLSILAWMITNYKFVSDDDRYDDLLHRIVDTLVRRMKAEKYDLNLLSFPRKPIWLPDNLVSLVALRNYGQLFGGKYQDVVEAWLHNAKTKWIHKKTGLLAGMLPGASFRQNSFVVRGSCTALNCSYLTMVDEKFAREQHELMVKYMTKTEKFLGKTLFGVKEYLTKSPNFEMKAGDAGLIVKGLSAGGTAFALGSATYLEDWKTRYEFLRTAELVSGTVKEKGMRHYKMSEMFLVGKATALAMRTSVKRNNNYKTHGNYQKGIIFPR